MTIATTPLVHKSDVDATIPILGTAPIFGVGGPTTYAIGAQAPIDTPVVAITASQHLSAKGIPCLQDDAMPAMPLSDMLDMIDSRMLTNLESGKLIL